MKYIIIKLALLLSLFGTHNAIANEAPGLGSSLKEIFLKGSVDGKKLFMVLGFKDASRIFKDSMRDAVNIDMLKDIGAETVDDASDLAGMIYNSGEGDYINAVQAGYEFSSDAAKEIIKSPLRSINKMKESYRISFEEARGAYYETENHTAASLKYAGHAVWANVKGAYYLVIEAPAKLLGASAATALGIPTAIAVQTLGIALKATFRTLGLAYDLTKYAINAIFETAKGAITLAYSGITTGLALTATTVATAIIGTAKGIKLLLTAPIKLFNKSYFTLETELDGKQLNRLIEVLVYEQIGSKELEALGVDGAITDYDHEKYKGKIVYKSDFDGRNKSAVKIKLTVKQGKIKIKTFMKNRQIRKLRKASDLDLSKKEFTALVKQNLMKLLQSSIEKVIFEEGNTTEALADAS